MSTDVSALTRVAPSAPVAPTVHPAERNGPLGRSGLDLLDVLGSRDELVARTASTQIALETGLEAARVSLLKGLPVDALATLDGVWQSAARTEDGWYLRGGALLLLGLSGESERVVSSGLAVRPASSALQFMQSLGFLMTGNLTSARAALGAALGRLPSDPLLLVQQAVLVARQGDRSGAATLLANAARRLPSGHPVLVYGANAVREAIADGARLRLTPAQGTATAVWVEASESPASVEPSPSHATGNRPADDRFSLEPVLEAFCRFGTRISALSIDAQTRELRSLLRALSAGGTLSSVTAPEVAHSARLLLSAMIATSRSDGIGARIAHEDAGCDLVLRALVAELLSALRSGELDVAQRALRRQFDGGRGSTMTMLSALVRGALPASVGGDTRRSGGHAALIGDEDIVSHILSVQEHTRGPLIPVRLGLRLLDDSPAARQHAQTALSRGDLRTGSHDVTGSAPGNVSNTPFAGSAVVGEEKAGAAAHTRHTALQVGDGNGSIDRPAGLNDTGGVPYAVGTAPHIEHREESLAHGRGVRVAAMLCVILGAGCAAGGYSVFAVAFGIGAAWFALRRSGPRAS